MICCELKRSTVRQLNSSCLPYYCYFADTGQAIYDQHRSKCHSYGLLGRFWLFFQLLVKALKGHLRTDSVDIFVHRFQRIHPTFRCLSTPTVYRYIDAGLLSLNNSDLPKKLRRRVRSSYVQHDRLNKKLLGKSIEDRPACIDDRITFGDWEGDLVKGKKVVSEPALMTLTGVQLGLSLS